MKHTLRPLENEHGSPIQIKDGDLTAVELEPGAKYFISVEIGDLPMSEANRHLQGVAEAFSVVVGKECVLVGARKNGEDQIKIYKLEPSSDEGL